MAKLTKKVVDGLRPDRTKDVFEWDSEIKGFGVRLKPSGVKTFIVQYRNLEGRSRRLLLGKYGPLTTELARTITKQKLALVAQGEDPAAEHRAARAGMTIGEVCDWYLTEAGGGRLLGRKRKPIKASTLSSDKSSIECHIKPLIGHRAVRSLTVADIEKLQSDILAGKTSKRRKDGRGGNTTGGAGAASRTIATVRAILGHAVRLKLVEKNPAEGVRQIRLQRRTTRLTADDISRLGRALDAAIADLENPTAIAAIRFLLLTGCRRQEVLSLRKDWVFVEEQSIHFPDTKSGAQVRVLGKEAIGAIAHLLEDSDSPFVFPADRGSGHFVGLPKALTNVCAKATLKGVTPHVFRHTFASIAGDLGFSELTIAGLLGHSARGVT
jgi:integrase